MPVVEPTLPIVNELPGAYDSIVVVPVTLLAMVLTRTALAPVNETLPPEMISSLSAETVPGPLLVIPPIPPASPQWHPRR